MDLYRLYVDETGNHDMRHANDPNQRFLSLTGVIVKSQYVGDTLIPEMAALKRAFFQQDPDEPVIFHRKEMVNKRPPFEALRDPDTRKRFDEALLTALQRWEYRVITVVIDKKEHKDRYMVWHYEPYHYCLAVMIERFLFFLREVGGKGDVMVESRGGKEDKKLKASYHLLYQHGTNYVSSHIFSQQLTSSQLKVKPKKANIAGLQLADLIAHPARQRALKRYGFFPKNKPPTFGDQIADILEAEKYLRSRRGDIVGFGEKLLP